MVISLNPRVAVVTGATGQLGTAVVPRLLQAGARVALPVRTRAKGEALRDELGDLANGPKGPLVLVVEADSSDAVAMQGFVETVLRTWERLDILVNVAGGYATAPATDLEAMESLWKQNVASAVTATAACLVPMRARGYGRIVSISAQSSLTGAANNSGYAMAKSAITRWTESLAAEVRPDGITANVVTPSSIGARKEKGRFVTPDEVASAILFLVSDEASGVTGAAVATPGG